MSLDDRVWDVAIVGYGPAGVACANLLGARGLDAVVVERDPSVFPRQRAIAIDDEALRVIGSMGLYEAATQHMHLGVTVEFIGLDGRPFFTIDPIETDASRHPQLNFFHQPELERVLREGVDRYPNVHLAIGLEFESTADADDHVIVTTRDVSTGERHRIAARYVLGCDGGSSAVRKDRGIPFAGESYDEQWFDVQAEVKRPFAESPHFRFICSPDRPGVDCPCPGGYHRWEWRINPGEDVEDWNRPERQWQLLAERGITPDDVEIKRSWAYTFHIRCAQRWRDGRVILVGDAAHVMPPFAGQGISGAFRDAANICWKLAHVLRGSADERILDTYQAERQPHHEAMSRAAVRLGRLVMPPSRTIARVRDLALRALSHVPGVRSVLSRNAIRPTPLRAGLLAGGSVAGQLIPWVHVVDGEGNRVKIDDALGEGFTVIAMDADPASAVGARAYAKWEAAGARFVTVRSGMSVVAPGELGDPVGELWTWFRRRGIEVAVIRPDRYIYAAGRRGGLPEPDRALAPVREEVLA